MVGILRILIVVCLTGRDGLLVSARETTTKMVEILFFMHWTNSVVQTTYLNSATKTGQSC